MGLQAFFSLVTVALVVFCLSMHHGDCWSLQGFAEDFCLTIGTNLGSSCNCVDIVVQHRDNQDACGWKPLGQGLYADSASITPMPNPPVPSSKVFAQTVCDGRNLTQGSLICTESAAQSIMAEMTVTTTESLGLTIHMEYVIGFDEIKVTIDNTTTTTVGTTITSTNLCGPGGLGQPAGTCNLYTESYRSYDFPDGANFEYSAVVGGGVQMSFDDAIDLSKAIGTQSDGSPHYRWYISIDHMVKYSQDNHIGSVSVFSPATIGTDVEYHGTGSVSGSYLGSNTVCNSTSCPSN